MTTLADQEKFLALLEEHKRILYKVANAYCPDREERPDLIQEMVVQLWRSFPRYDGRYRFSTWMYRVVMNVAISLYRGEGRRSRETVSIEGIDIAVADQVMETAGDDIRLLERLIRQLDEMSRAVILLYLEGYAHAEIAEIVGITNTNVATRINRIKQRLQREYSTA